MKRFFKKFTASLLAALLLLSYTPNASASSLSDVSTEMSYSLLQDIIDLYLETSLYESDRETLINTMLYNYLASDPLALASLANALLSANDPYSAYYLADSGFLSDSSKAYGVIVEDSDGFDEDDSRAPGVYIRDVIKGSNAAFAGILPGDRFVAVEGVNVEGLSSAGIQNFLKLMPSADKDPSLSKVFLEFSSEIYDPERYADFKKLNWNPAKEVSMTFERTLSDGSKSLYTTSLPKGIAKKQDVSYALDKENGYGIITVAGFDEPSIADDFLAAFYKAKDDGCDKLILDLRDNPGGYFEAAKELGSCFTKGEKVMFYTRSRGEEPQPTYSKNNYIGDTFSEYVVLINENTASAAELFAYILHNECGAALIGETSYGKAVGQDAYTVTNGDRFTITSFEILRTDLSSYNEKGLEPDVYIPLTREKYAFPTGLSHFNSENFVEITDGARNDATLALEQRFGILGLLRSDAIDGLCDSSTRAAIYIYRALIMREKTPLDTVTFDMVASMTERINSYKDKYVYFDSQMNVATLYLTNHSRGKRLASEYITAEEKLVAAEEERRHAEEEEHRRTYEEEMNAEAGEESEGESEG